MGLVDYQVMEVANGKAVKIWAQGVAIEAEFKNDLDEGTA